MGFSKTTWNNGSAPGISATELNRIEDGIEAAAPTGGLMMFVGSSAPTGWLLCDGSAVSRTTYADLFAVIGTTYGAGDGSTTFNVPDLRQRFPLGKAASGTGDALGDTGGEIDATMDLDHVHDIGHSHGNGSLGTSAAGSHSHTVNSHTHLYNISHDHGSFASDATTLGSEYGADSSPGLYSRNDLAVFSSSTAHSHGDGSYSAGGVPVSGTSASASASHTHTPSSRPHDHTHTVDVPAYSVPNGSTGASAPGTNTESDHSHTITGSLAAHSGDSGSALSGTESVPNPPFLVVNFIVKV